MCIVSQRQYVQQLAGSTKGQMDACTCTWTIQSMTWTHIQMHTQPFSGSEALALTNCTRDSSSGGVSKFTAATQTQTLHDKIKPDGKDVQTGSEFLTTQPHAFNTAMSKLNGDDTYGTTVLIYCKV